MATETEHRWLDYAWGIVDCPSEHRAACTASGGAAPGEGRVDGNELRWPGYLGRNWEPERGVLCVGAVHREGDPVRHVDPVNVRTDEELVSSNRAWLASGRSLESDEHYLRATQTAYVDALPTWARWNRHFRPLVEDMLGMDTTQIAWANLARCRVSIDRGARERSAEKALTRLCQRSLSPMSDLVAAIRPAAVLCCVLGAVPGGDIVSSWDAPDWSPSVYVWFGLTGHDRHNTDPDRRAFSEWAPEAALAIKKRQGVAASQGAR